MIQEKEYLKPKLDVIEFEEDVILTSGGCNPHRGCMGVVEAGENSNVLGDTLRVTVD